MQASMKQRGWISEAHVDGSVEPETSNIDGGFCVRELPSLAEAERWARIKFSCRTRREFRHLQYDPES